MNTEISVLIKTIGRSSLQDAINSAIREDFTEIIVVADGCSVNVKGAKIIELPKRWGFYGAVAANVGIGFCTKSYVLFLDDDDELSIGSGEIIRAKIAANNNVDIWIPALLYNDGIIQCDGSVKKVLPGNVAVPICKTEVLISLPFKSTIPKRKIFFNSKIPKDINKKTIQKEQYLEYLDYFYIHEAHQSGYIVDWIGAPIYLVRPKSKGSQGRGQ